MKITGRIVKDFTLDDMACNDVYGTLEMTAEFVAHARRVQELRDWYNRPMIVASWYRTPEYNESVGGEDNSYHLEGVATDIYVPKEYATWTRARKNEFFDNLALKWFQICQKDGIGGGFGKYNTFFHIDSGQKQKRNPKSLTMWDFRK